MSRPKNALALLALCLPALFSGCMYSQVVTPLDTNVHETVLGDKIGRSSQHSVLFSVAWGDAGTQAAAEDGGITTIHHMDQELLNILFGLYIRRTTILYGE